MRDNVTDVRLGAEGVQNRVRLPRERRSAAPAADIRLVPALAVTAAMALADGDPSRLVFNDDGSVTILNAPRTPERDRPKR